MSIQEIHIDNAEQWDNAVRKSAKYDVFYLSSYLRAFQQRGSGEPILIIYSFRDDYAVNAIFKRDIAEDKNFLGALEKRKYYDVSTPYGYGGFIGNISDTKQLNDEWRHYCLEKNYVCEFIRFELLEAYQNYYDGEVIACSHNVVRDLSMSLDDMWMDFKQKVRKNVKRAMQHNLEILVEYDDTHLNDFLRIYNLTMDRNHALKSYYFDEKFFHTINNMKNNIAYFYVFYEGQIISAELVIYGSENCYSYLGGTDDKYFEMRPNDFLKYEIIKWAKNKGLKKYILGGGYGKDDGIFQYKQCFSPNGIVDFYIGRQIFDQKTYDKLKNLRGGSILDRNYFPIYRG